MSVIVTKADGTQEEFKVAKLRHSLKRAGATNAEIKHVVTEVKKILHEEISTQEIYRHAFELLHNSPQPIQARYSMRRALFGLGPTGFPFEDFIARLFQAEGYTTQTGVEIQGNCALHEIDIAAYREDHSFVGEAKFHSRPGIKSDLQVAMYSYARFLDLQKKKVCKEDNCGIGTFLLITNTKFTSTAEQYGECVGLQLLSWDYPKGNTLHDRIQRANIYPVTTLQSLSQSQKVTLLDTGAIICADILASPARLNILHLSKKRVDEVLAEARKLTQQS